MYSVAPSFTLGFHGCDKSVADLVLSGKGNLKKSENAYDWLGSGVYFWESSPERALNYANELKSIGRGQIEIPYVVGSIIDLGYCLNLSEAKSLELLKQSYAELAETYHEVGVNIPQNKLINNDLLLRHLDCQVI